MLYHLPVYLVGQLKSTILLCSNYVNFFHLRESVIIFPEIVLNYFVILVLTTNKYNCDILIGNIKNLLVQKEKQMYYIRSQIAFFTKCMYTRCYTHQLFASVYFLIAA